MPTPKAPVIQIQPTPNHALYSHLASGPTAIVRFWDPGDTKRCRLCPREHCTARGDVCLVLVSSHVPREETLMFSTVGLPRRGHDGGRTHGAPPSPDREGLVLAMPPRSPA